MERIGLAIMMEEGKAVDADENQEERAIYIHRVYSAVKLPARVKDVGQASISRPTASSSMHMHKASSAQSGPLAATSKSGSRISSVTFCPSKRRLYIGTESGDLSFWVLESAGASSQKFVISQLGLVSCLSIPQPSDGSLMGKRGLILSGSASGNIGIWEYHGRVAHDPTISVQTLYGHKGTVTGIECYGNHILSTSTDGTLRVWKSAEGRQHLAYPWFEAHTTLLNTQGWLRSMSFGRGEGEDMGVFFISSDGGSVAKITPDEMVQDDGSKLIKTQVFHVSTFLGAPLNDVNLNQLAQDRGIIALKLIPSWNILFTISYDNCIRGYDILVGAIKWEWENEGRSQFVGLEVDLEFGEVLAVDLKGRLSIFSVRSGALFATKALLSPSSPPAVSIHRIQRQRYAVTTANDVTVWEVNHELDYNILRGGHEKAVISLYACTGGVGASEGEKDFRIFSASEDNTVRLWDPFDMACVRVLEHTSIQTDSKATLSGPIVAASEISSMTFYEAWRILVTGHENGDLRLWDMDTGRSKMMAPQHSNSISCMSMAILRKNEELLLSGGYDGWVVVWDIRHVRGEPPHMISKFKAHGPGSPSEPGVEADKMPSSSTLPSNGLISNLPSPEVLCIIHDPVKKVIFTGGNDGVIKVWSVAGYALKGYHKGHAGAVTCLALDSNFLFSGSDDCEIRVWDAVPAIEENFKDGVNRRSALSGLQDEGLENVNGGLVSSGFSNEKPLTILSGHTSAISSIQVLWGCGGQVLSSSLDGSLRVWDYVAGEQIHKYIAPGGEELRCMAVRSDKPEILAGTSTGSILCFPLPSVSIKASTYELQESLELSGTSKTGVDADTLTEIEEEEEYEDSDKQDDVSSSGDVGADKQIEAQESKSESARGARSLESFGMQKVQLILPKKGYSLKSGSFL